MGGMEMNYYDILEDIKNKLIELNIFKSVKIGLESSLSSKSAPFIRIIPIENENDGVVEVFSFKVVYGFLINSNLEELYKLYYETEEKIKKALEPQYEFVKTITDEDLLEKIKSAVMFFKVKVNRW